MESPEKRLRSRYRRDEDGEEEEEEAEREDRDTRHKRHRASASASDEDGHHQQRRPHSPERQRHYDQQPHHKHQPPAQDILYRILCPIPKIGAVIGKGGSTVKTIRYETGAKIRVEDIIPGAEERVICVHSSPGQDVERGMDGRPAVDADGEEYVCPAQHALFKIIDLITQANGERDEEDGNGQSLQITVRLLVPESQIGRCVIGKAGRIIEQMRKEIPAQIHVLPKASLPPCALPTEELVQLSGTLLLVKRALFCITKRLFENPPKERSPVHVNHAAFSTGGNFTFGGGPMVGYAGPVPCQAPLPAQAELMISVLCPNEWVGQIIGKGGGVIRKVRENSGAKIKVCDQIADSDERIIEVSAMECIDDFMSPVLEAAMQIQRRLVEIANDKDPRNGVTVLRMLIPGKQIGCLLGKGGQIINEMRKVTRTNIRIPRKEELPRCADKNSELVQISGEPRAVETALSQVLSRLRTNLFKVHETGSHVLPMSDVPSYGRRNGPYSPEPMYRREYGNYSKSPSGTASGRSSKYSKHDYRSNSTSPRIASSRSSKDIRRRPR